MSLKRLVKSFSDAGRGFKHAFKNEQNFRTQLVIAAVVVLAALYFPLRVWELILVILMVVSVLATELLNTALENFTDLLKPRLHHYVFVVKDVMAAAVLLVSLGALVIGLIIFLPHFINLFK